MVSLERLLEESRRELLDLSTRNRLLSMPVESKSARVIHVRDEKSDHVLRLLASDRKTVAFLPGIEKDMVKTQGGVADKASLDLDDDEPGCRSQTGK